MYIGGPCYNPEDQIVCRFNKTLATNGSFISQEQAYCITPGLYVAGRIPVELSLDGGLTYNFTGTFRSSRLTIDFLIFLQHFTAQFLNMHKIL